MSSQNSSLGNSTASICIICDHGVSNVITVLQVLFGVSVFSINVLTLVLLLKSTTLKKSIRLSLINLVVIDIVVGLIFIYHYSVVYHIFSNAIECRIRYILVSVLAGATLTTVTLLSVERVFALQFPFRHSKLVTTPVIRISILSSWIGPLVVVTGVLPYNTPISECNYLLITDKKTDIVFAIINLSYVTVSVTCHVIMYMVARRQIQKIIPNFIGKEQRNMEMRMNMKAALSTTMIVLPYIVCTTPFYLLFLVIAINPHLKNNLTTLYVTNSLFTLSSFTSLFNPLLFGWKLPELRQTFWKMVGRQPTIRGVDSIQRNLNTMPNSLARGYR